MFLEEKYMPIIEFLTWAGYHSGRNFDIISKLGAVTEYGGTHRFEIYISYDVITKTDIPSDLKWKFELVNSYECSNNHSIKLVGGGVFNLVFLFRSTKYMKSTCFLFFFENPVDFSLFVYLTFQLVSEICQNAKVGIMMLFDDFLMVLQLLLI